MSPTPKQFEEDQALEYAMELFWEKGYEATSIQNLVDHMGINRFSIYENFGSKHELFLSACERYKKIMEERRIRRLREGEAGIEAIRAFFHEAIRAMAEPGGAKGCLMTNSIVELATHDTALKKTGTEFLLMLEDAFHEALKRAKKKQELHSKRNLHELAGYLMSVTQGLGVVGKTNNDSRQLRQVVKIALSQL